MKHNTGLNKEVKYRVLIYNEHGEIIEDTDIVGQDNAYNYGEKRTEELGLKNTSYKVKVD